MAIPAAQQPHSPDTLPLSYRLALVAVLAGVLLALYGGMIHAGFLLDDFWLCRHVPRLGHGALVLLTSSFGFFYRPTFLIYFSALLTLFGPSSVAFHICSVLLHAAVCALLYKLAKRLTGSRLAAMLAASLFIIFPTNKEPVTWISSASTLLAGLFLLAAIHAWLSYRATGRVGYGVAVLALGVLALGSKEDSISLPAVLLLMELLNAPSAAAGGPRPARWLILSALTVIAVVYARIDLTTYHHWVAGNHIGMMPPTLPEKLHVLGVYARILMTQNLGFLQPLSVLHWLQVLAGALLFLSIAAWRDPSRLIPLLTIVIILTALPLPLAVGMHSLADRFFYTPGLMLCLLAAVAIGRLLQSPLQLLQLTGAALLASIAAQCISTEVLSNDPFVEFLIFAIEIGACVLAVRSNALPASVAVCMAMASLGSQVALLGFPDAPAAAPLLILAATCTAVTWRTAWWLGGVFVLCLLGKPDISFGLFVAFRVAMLLSSRLTHSPKPAAGQSQAA